MKDSVIEEIKKQCGKVRVLNNGSISLNYAHRISNGENVGEIVEHIIKTLYIASEYLVLKTEVLMRWFVQIKSFLYGCLGVSAQSGYYDRKAKSY